MSKGSILEVIRSWYAQNKRKVSFCKLIYRLFSVVHLEHPRIDFTAGNIQREVHQPKYEVFFIKIALINMKNSVHNSGFVHIFEETFKGKHRAYIVFHMVRRSNCGCSEGGPEHRISILVVNKIRTCIMGLTMQFFMSILDGDRA